jgi:hypothetical protein
VAIFTQSQITARLNLAAATAGTLVLAAVTYFTLYS